MTLDGESSGLGGMTPLVSTEEAHEQGCTLDELADGLDSDNLSKDSRRRMVGNHVFVLCVWESKSYSLRLPFSW
jgi:hypothetical protein